MTEKFKTQFKPAATSFNTFDDRMVHDGHVHSDVINSSSTVHDQQTNNSNFAAQYSLTDKQYKELEKRLALPNSGSLLDNDPCNLSICEGCEKIITDNYVMKVKLTAGDQVTEKTWHERCLRCCTCGQTMAGRCYERNCKLYCSDDYYRLFGGQCSICTEPIAMMELVMKATPERFCHVSCFRCMTCQRSLGTGDMYSVNEEKGWPYCQYHASDAYAPPHHNQMPKISVGHSGSSVAYWSDDCLDEYLQGNGKTDKRPRTVLSSGQFGVLKTAFDNDPRPSKKARHVMSIETGLTSRVVQVWFQNQRAKMKKRSRSSAADESGMIRQVDDLLNFEDYDKTSDFQMTLCSNDSSRLNTYTKHRELSSSANYLQYWF